MMNLATPNVMSRQVGVMRARCARYECLRHANAQSASIHAVFAVAGEICGDIIADDGEATLARFDGRPSGVGR